MMNPALWRELDTAVEDLRALLPGQDPGRTCVGHWTIHDTAAHVLDGLRLHTDILRGTPSPVDLDAPDEYALKGIAACAGMSSEEIGAEIERSWRIFRDEAESHPGNDELSWHSGKPIAARTLIALAVAEVVLHGFDIHSAAGSAYRPSDELAATILLAVVPVAVLLQPSARVPRVELRLRRHGSVFLHRADGRLVVGTRRWPGPPDCVLIIEPLAALMFSYGRYGLARAMVTGRPFAYGLRPWTALSLRRMRPTA
ncbi:maleylpyruvate isomerase N-terminal domain-containing protein [Nocardia sp. NPDC046763]|uniref:maleylpyruvate isomerase N-terminal domain-containing protein n=1 Tax=Nocardia sp. NPDC046763 TaxID=3155256 RepID=UPI0033E672EA